MEDRGVSSGPPPSQAHSAAKLLKNFLQLNMSGLAVDTYDDNMVGPLKPGNRFFDTILGAGPNAPPLQIPIPDTVVVNDADKKVQRLYTDPATGCIIKESVAVDSLESRDKFISSCIKSVAATAQPLISNIVFPPGASLMSIPPLKINEPMQDRTCAIFKRPVKGVLVKDKNTRELLVANHVETLSPLAYQSMLCNACDFRTGDGTLILQKFVKPKGKRASIYRVFWRAESIGVGIVTGWRVTKATDTFSVFNKEQQEQEERELKLKDKKAQYDLQNNNSAGGNEDHDDERNGDDERGGGGFSGSNNQERSSNSPQSRSPKKEVLDFRRITTASEHKKLLQRDADFLSSMNRQLDLTEMERSRALREAISAHRHAGFKNVCTLTDDKGEVTQMSTSQLTITRVSRDALKEVQVYIERLVHWIQTTIRLSDHLIFHFSDIVCDFIRDDQGKWWFIQCKGFAPFPLSVERIKVWHSLKQKGKSTRTQKKMSEVLDKLERERGRCCAMCGLNFQEGQLIQIEIAPRDEDLAVGKEGGVDEEDEEDDDKEEDEEGEEEEEGGEKRTRGASSKLKSKTKSKAKLDGREGDSRRGKPLPSGPSAPPPPSRLTSRQVPAYGYALSVMAATRLAESYRDGRVPLTKQARHLIEQHSISIDSLTVSTRLKVRQSIFTFKFNPFTCFPFSRML